MLRHMSHPRTPDANHCGRGTPRVYVRSRAMDADPRGAAAARGSHGGAVAVLGPVPQRAPVGHRPRGLQRQRRRLVVLQPRPGPLARLPLGRGRARRDQRRAPAAVLRAGAVERAGPDPQGAPVRADQQRGQPRRGRQGVLLLRRQPADPLATSAGCTSTRSAAFPYADLVATNRRRSRYEMEYELLDTGVFDDDRYFDVEVNYAKAGPRRHPLPHHRAQPRARGRRRSTCCRRCGSATRGRSRRTPPSRRCARVDGRRPVVRAEHHAARHVAPARRPTAPSCCSATTSPTPPACGAPTNSPPYPKDGIADHVVHGTPTRQPRRRRAPRRPPTSASSCRPAARRRRGCASTATAPRRVADPFADADDVVAAPARRGRRVLRRDHPAGGRRRRRRR